MIPSLAPTPPATLKNLGEIDFNDQELRLDYDSDDELEGGTEHRYYRSEKILGELYRAIDEKRIWEEDIKIRDVYLDDRTVWDDVLEKGKLICHVQSIAWNRYLDEAEKIQEM